MGLIANSNIRVEFYERIEAFGEVTDTKIDDKEYCVRWDAKVEKFQDRFHTDNQDDFTRRLANVSTQNEDLAEKILTGNVDDRKLIKIFRKDLNSQTEKEYRIVDVGEYSLLPGLNFIVKEGAYQ